MNRPVKILLIILGILVLIFGGFYLFIHIAFDGIFTGPSYTKQDLIDNYEQRKSEVIEVKTFLDSKISSDTYIDVEFDNRDLGIFHVKKNGTYDSNWDLDIDSKKTDSLLNVIGLTKNDLITLETKLGKANCISVASGNPTRIGWQRSGMGKFFYDIFDQNLNDSLISQYNGGCTYIYYKDNVVLEYGGGAIGPQCFPGYERKK
ncbi:hypothetical protein [Maribacter cobaltidurans]|uniref:Uncharacterized protein n=1 Tax=Maribacter cobaltidurans TaxID=1178778 RepID=A0A223V5P2_9FLAO|nr:hypothetical protein [Maribacter cobaltidurans]ASV30622.1 hypothetical protein CJ263_10590 [Maribacter cobaltidurans]GGD80355.1 hypothetical protein GCM10011412_17660 [Maribacter cobaltidurans]